MGATSPLHTVTLAVVRALFGSHWLLVAQLLKRAFVICALIVLFPRRNLSWEYFPLLAAFLLSFETLWVSTAQLFETGWTTLAVSLLISLVNGRADRAAAALAGATGRRIRVYGEKVAGWARYSLVWNSVYQVEQPATKNLAPPQELVR